MADRKATAPFVFFKEYYGDATTNLRINNADDWPKE